MLYKKITHGFVVQTFNDAGQCVKQEFFVSDENDEFETEDGDEINKDHMPFGGNEYFPFDMIQPTRE